MVVENGQKATCYSWKWSTWTIILYLALSCSHILMETAERSSSSPGVEESTGFDALFFLALLPFFFIFLGGLLVCFVATVWVTLDILDKKLNVTTDKLLAWLILIFSWVTLFYINKLGVSSMLIDPCHHDSFFDWVLMILHIKGCYLVWKAIVLGDRRQNKWIRICRAEMSAGICLFVLMGVFFLVAPKMHIQSPVLTLVAFLVPDVLIGVIINAVVLRQGKVAETANDPWANPFVPWIRQLTLFRFCEKCLSAAAAMQSRSILASKLVKALIIILLNALLGGYIVYGLFGTNEDGSNDTALKNHAERLYTQIMNRDPWDFTP